MEQTKQSSTAAFPADTVNAFCRHGAHAIAGRDSGPLRGLSFAAKDLLDVEGHVTGCGNPDWLATHAAATRTAPVVQALLDAGASLAGKTHTDELAYSLNGENWHYGTPVNIRAPGRVPGGSSSGSAAAVAAGLVDFALGTDTGGSVRVPASYCGVYGIRTTHGRVTVDGCMPLAPSFDTIGWFADSGALLAQVGGVLLHDDGRARRRHDLLIAQHLFDETDDDVRSACREALPALRTAFDKSSEIVVSTTLHDWSIALRTILAVEAWRSHGEWITTVAPALGPGVRDRFQSASRVDEQRLASAIELRRQARARVHDLVGDDRIIVLPTTPCVALPLDLPSEQLEPIRSHILDYTCIAGIGGLPQVNLPVRRSGSLPVGISLIGPRGSDEALLALAASIPAL
jgi:amidase